MAVSNIDYDYVSFSFPDLLLYFLCLFPLALRQSEQFVLSFSPLLGF